MKIDVFGEILWDVFDKEKKIGGAPFIFAAHAVREGARVSFISAVGRDEAGDQALRECARMNLSTDYIVRTDYPTGSCRVKFEGETPVYDFSGEMAYDHIPLPQTFCKSSGDPESTECSAIRTFQQPALAGGDDGPCAFYFGTLAQRKEESKKTLKALLSESGCRYDAVFLDLNIRREYYSAELVEESIRAATILKLSRDEIKVLQIPGNLPAVCKTLVKKYRNLEMVIVTLDRGGALVYEKDGTLTRSEKPDYSVVSAAGADEAFSAGFLVQYLKGGSVRECLKRACRLARQICEHREAVPRYLMDDVRKWKAVYRLLNHVETEVYDCGTLCDSACCVCRGSTEDMGIYLFPGEHLLLAESEKEGPWLTWEQQDPAEINFPESWTGPVYFVNCKTPPVCPRKWRPLQCRTFPLKPVIGENGVLELIWEDDELPYTCPIIEQNLPIHDSFYKATYTVWSHLLKDRRIMDLVLSWS